MHFSLVNGEFPQLTFPIGYSNFNGFDRESNPSFVSWMCHYWKISYFHRVSGFEYQIHREQKQQNLKTEVIIQNSTPRPINFRKSHLTNPAIIKILCFTQFTSNTNFSTEILVNILINRLNFLYLFLCIIFKEFLSHYTSFMFCFKCANLFKPTY